jgi:hypothetical protein
MIMHKPWSDGTRWRQRRAAPRIKRQCFHFAPLARAFTAVDAGLQGMQPEDGSHHTLRHSHARGTPDETREFLSPLHCFELWLRAQLESSSKTSGRHPATTKVTAVAIAMAVAAWSGAAQGTGTESLDGLPVEGCARRV